MKIKLVTLSIMVLSIALFSCKKEGCTDPIATNYDEDAKKDDNSCEYEDTTPEAPVITLNGQDTISLNLGDSYIEEGATASDETGANLTVDIDASDLDTTQAGMYEVLYSATNEGGTSTVSRIVIIEITAANILGDYTHNSDCSGTQFPLNDASFVAGGANFEFIIEDAFNLIAGDIIGIVDNDQVDVPFQTVDVEVAGNVVGSIEFDGTGTINPSATEVTITFNYNNTVPLTGGQGSCTAVYTMQ